jgi:aminoglycoside phosphotransferase (APT) family kinase protein
MESGPIVAVAKHRLGLDVAVVRLLEGERFPGGPVTYLVEAPGVAPDALAPFTGQLVEDARRPRYAEIGGVAGLVDWADRQLDRVGAARAGEPEQVRTWNLSCLLRVPSTIGPLWLKAVPEFFAHEGTVLRALAAVDPSLVPSVVAAEPGVTLMETAGNTDGYGIGPDHHFDAVARFARASVGLDLADLASVPRFDLGDLQARLADLADRHGHELEPEERLRLDRLADEAGDRWRSAGGLDPVLVHGDLHGGNLRFVDPDLGVGGDLTRGDSVILDWGDAAITHPLFELAVLDGYTPDWPVEATDRWLELLGVGRPEWQAFRPLAALRMAVIYRHLCDGIETSEQIYHLGDIVPSIRRGLGTLSDESAPSVERPGPA